METGKATLNDCWLVHSPVYSADHPVGTRLVHSPGWGDRDAGRNPTLCPGWDFCGEGGCSDNCSEHGRGNAEPPGGQVTDEDRSRRRAWLQEAWLVRALEIVSLG